MEKYNVGDVLTPYPGGGDHGRCLRCKRVGLTVIDVPQEAPQKPVGWRKIPEE